MRLVVSFRARPLYIRGKRRRWLDPINVSLLPAVEPDSQTSGTNVVCAD
jgi:hypothetical protein